MIRVFDYKCPDGHLTEVFGKGQSSVECPVCGAPAEKQLSAPPCKLEGWSGAFPGRAMRWEREHWKAGMKKSDDNE